MLFSHPYLLILDKKKTCNFELCVYNKIRRMFAIAMQFKRFANLAWKDSGRQKGRGFMEARFENQCVLTKKHMRDHLRIITRWRCWALYGGVWLVLVLMIISNLVQDQTGIAIYAMCLLAVTLLAFFAVPEIQAALRYRRWYYIAFRDTVAQASFYEDRIVYSSEAEPQPVEYDYKKLRTVIVCDDMILLLMKGKGEVLLGADGFQKGNPDKFKAFLQRKAPKAKIKW